MVLSRVRHILIVAVAAILFPVLASAATADFRILIDVDNNAATGCAQSGMQGIEQTLVLRVVTTETEAQVTRSYRQICTGGAFGPPVDEDLTPRPVSFHPPLGLLMVESRLPFSALTAGGGMPGRMRLGFEALSGPSTHQALTHANGAPILYPPLS